MCSSIAGGGKDARQLAHPGSHSLKVSLQNPRMSDEDDGGAGSKCVLLEAVGFAQAALDRIALHRTLHPPAGGECHLPAAGFHPDHVHQLSALVPARFKQLLKSFGPAQNFCFGKAMPAPRFIRH